MKKFKFKLNSILKLREAKESQYIKRLVMYQNYLKLKKNEKNELVLKMSRYFKREKCLDIVGIKIEHNYILSINQKIKKLEIEIKKIKDSVDQSMFDYLEARKRKEIIEKLFEKDNEKHNIKNSKEEKKKIEDLILMRFRLKADYP